MSTPLSRVKRMPNTCLTPRILPPSLAAHQALLDAAGYSRDPQGHCTAMGCVAYTPNAGEPVYPQNHVGRGSGIRNGARGAVRLPKILVLTVFDALLLAQDGCRGFYRASSLSLWFRQVAALTQGYGSRQSRQYQDLGQRGHALFTCVGCVGFVELSTSVLGRVGVLPNSRITPRCGLQVLGMLFVWPVFPQTQNSFCALVCACLAFLTPLPGH